MTAQFTRACLRIFFLITILLVAIGTKTYANESVTLQFMWPTDGVLTDTFGSRNGKHFGIDIAAETGTPVFASESGKVVKSYYSRSYGNVIFIQHENQMETVYAHLHKRFVKEGDYVKKGDQIGEVGTTGRSTGSHLHFEVHNGPWDIHKSTAINPLLVLEEPNENSKLVTANSNEESKLANTKQPERIVIRIKKGDTLWDISRRYNVTVKEIMNWNNLHSSLIYVDQKLTIFLDEKV